MRLAVEYAKAVTTILIIVEQSKKQIDQYMQNTALSIHEGTVVPAKRLQKKI